MNEYLYITTDDKGDNVIACSGDNVPKTGIAAHDNVDHPSHYTKGGIECIEGIRAALTKEEFEGFCKGNVLKYVWRERSKNGTEDLKKAFFYLKKLISVREET